MFTEFLHKIERELINPLITVLALVAFIVFVWGVVQFIANAGDEEKRSIGKRHMVYGLIGLAIIFGAKAIIAIAAGSFGLSVPTT